MGGVLTSILKLLLWSRLLNSARRALDVGLRTRLEIWEAYLNVYANTMVTRMARAGAGVLRVVFASCAGLVLSRVENCRLCWKFSLVGLRRLCKFGCWVLSSCANSTWADAIYFPFLTWTAYVTLCLRCFPFGSHEPQDPVAQRARDIADKGRLRLRALWRALETPRAMCPEWRAAYGVRWT